MLTKKELVKQSKFSMSKIDRLMLQGLPYMKIGGSVRFDEKKVMEWFESHSIETITDDNDVSEAK